MNFLKIGTEFVGDVGFGVIKNSGRLIYGSGQTIVGMVTEDDELVENGVKNLGHGAFGLTVGVVKKAVGGDKSEDGDDDIYSDSIE